MQDHFLNGGSFTQEKKEYKLVERQPHTVPFYERRELHHVRDVIERYTNPDLVLQNTVVQGPGHRKHERHSSLAEIDLLFLYKEDGVLATLEVGAEKEESKPDMFSRKLFYLSKIPRTEQAPLRFDKVVFLEFNGGPSSHIEIRPYTTPLECKIVVGVSCKNEIDKLTRRQVRDAFKELEMKRDIPLNYYAYLLAQQN